MWAGVDQLLKMADNTGASSSSIDDKKLRLTEKYNQMMKDPEVAEWSKRQFQRLGGFQNSPPPNAMADRALRVCTAESHTCWAYRDGVTFSPVMENPHQYINMVNGRPTVFIILTFETPQDEEIQPYWATKFAPLKVMALYSRWANAPHEKQTKCAAGAFWDCMKEMVVEIGTASCWPRDIQFKSKHYIVLSACTR